LSSSDGPPSASVLLLSGAITGLTISSIETPIDLIKTKLQIQIFRSQFDSSYKPPFSSTFGCFRYILTHHGVVGLWQGWTATAIRNTPANALFFPGRLSAILSSASMSDNELLLVNELMKRYFAQLRNVHPSELDLGPRLAAGASAGLCYWVGTYPLDVVKGRLQAQSIEGRQSWINTARSIWKENGFRGFTRGLAPCAARAVPACSAMFFTGEPDLVI
jgi:hypothetical protein